MKKLFALLFFLFSLFKANLCLAHPMPNSLVLLTVKEHQILMELQLPVQEFELAYGKELANADEQFINSNKARLIQYILSHVHINSPQSKNWDVSLLNIKVDSTSNQLNGVYKELIFQLICIPHETSSVRNFTLYYDAIIHQVVTHFAIVKIIQDFNNGVIPSEPSEIGIIQLDIASNQVKPFSVNLDEGSRWNGLRKMFLLGMNHIRQGVDHLLFLFVTLLIAPLLSIQGKWLGYGGHSYFIKRVLKIVTAFTIGHSLTLLVISFYNIPNYTSLIETAIALTILLSSINAVKPIFARQEVVLTFFFGLIHGAAFAGTLFNLNLDHSLKLLSVFSFNAGIEVMQIIILLVYIPLLLLSRFSVYKYIRLFGALISILASLGWVFARIFNHENLISTFMNNLFV